MPELALHPFHLFYSFFGKHDKSSELSWKFCFGKNIALKEDFHRISLQFRLDELIR